MSMEIIMDIDVDSLDLEEIMELVEQIELYKKYNKVDTFNPYKFQLNMFEAGKKYRSRFACLANRIGKTFSASAEVSYHLTGNYPDWWTGIKYDRPIKLWAVGITTKSTKEVLQNEILGTDNGKQLKEIGTGSIPREYIDFDTLVRDGDTVKTVKIKHYTNGVYDGLSTLDFRSTQQGTQVFMGQTIDFILIDEEDKHKSMEIFSQCLTRTSTVEDGRVLITATPENGYTNLIKKFEQEDDLFIFHAGWDDAPHLTEEVKKELLAGIPEWEVAMRTKGIPSRGSGAIFQVDDSDIMVDPFIPPKHWPVIAGLDFGKSKDPSIISYVAKDPDNEVYYLYDCEYMDDKRHAKDMAQRIINGATPSIPVIAPGDAAQVTEDGGDTTRAKIMRDSGVNVLTNTFSNPQWIQNKITNSAKKHAGKEAGLVWMNHQMKEGKLKVCSNVIKFFEEKRTYFYVERGGKTKPKDGDDHVIDATRQAMLSIDRFGDSYGNCTETLYERTRKFDNYMEDYNSYTRNSPYFV